MAVYYFDTSALVKRYVLEKGSAFVAHATSPLRGNQAWSASIDCVEVVAAFARRVNTGLISAAEASNAEQAFRNDLHHLFRVLDLSPNILASAMGLKKLHSLRAYDAVQLATAIEYQLRRKTLNLQPLTFLCADQMLNQAALAEGLLADDPNRYP